MHRKAQLDKSLREWLDLELETTCVRADSFTRYLIEKKGNPKEIHITNRRTQQTVAILGESGGGLAYVTGYDEKDEFVNIGLALWALQNAVAQY